MIVVLSGRFVEVRPSTLLSYRHLESDPNSLDGNRVMALFQDSEGNIWTGMHEVEPNFFATKPLPFENLAHESDNPDCLNPSLIGAIYEDQNNELWVSVDRRLKRIDRKTGQCSIFHAADGSEVLSIIEDGPDTLWLGNAGPGLLRYDRRTGALQGYRHDPADPHLWRCLSDCSSITGALARLGWPLRFQLLQSDLHALQAGSERPRAQLLCHRRRQQWHPMAGFQFRWSATFRSIHRTVYRDLRTRCKGLNQSEQQPGKLRVL
jgi:hypothetical protein